MLPQTRMVFNFAGGFKNRFHGNRPGHCRPPGPASAVDAAGICFFILFYCIPRVKQVGCLYSVQLSKSIFFTATFTSDRGSHPFRMP